ncbi:MAG: LacI family transcriptional regulator [Firmicutes bacterium]|nr:LacI family transcriptional regulator [Bacillota bacterium]
MATINEVAKLAGVSKATVSRVLNNRPVSSETYAKVMKAIRELKYQPNAQARSLSLRRAKVIGLIAPDLQGVFHGPIIMGVEQVLQNNDFNLIVSRVQSKEYRLAKMLKEKKVDGLIITTPRQIGEKAILALKRDNFPVVVIDGNVGKQVSSVEIDNYQGAFQATEHLIKLGHTRIAVISSPPSFRESQERLLGYQDALKQYNLPFDSTMVREGDYLLPSGEREMEKLLALPSPPTAVFAFSDLMAIGAIHCLFKKGFSVPKDMAVIGFDDSIVAQSFYPPLTTVRQPIMEMGVVAARKMLAILSGEEVEPTHVILQTSLVVRASCGADLHQ